MTTTEYKVGMDDFATSARSGSPRQRLLQAIKGRPDLIDRLLVVAEPITAPTHIRDQQDAYRVLAPIVAGLPTEHLAVAALDNRGRVIGTTVLTVGSDQYTVICPRQVFRWALLQGRSGARAVLLAHNHPSGDPTPSDTDHAVTRVVAQAGQVIGIPLHDHLVIGSGGRYRSITAQVGR